MAPTLLSRIEGAAAPGDLDDVTSLEPIDERDALLSLLAVHDIHTAPVDKLQWQHHPAVADLKWRLEDRFLARLGDDEHEPDAVTAMRRLAAKDLVPPVYEWLADDATLPELVEFLSLEGGPDGGIDVLVAACRIGLAGEPKVELAPIHWDEMGNGSVEAELTEPHDRLVTALGLRAVPRAEQPIEALERAALGTLLATNRALQAEMAGAVGLVELQAGPRCRNVLAALRRLHAPLDAFPFYEEHVLTDPRHGKDWLDHVIQPLADDPTWSARIVRGARWRSDVDAQFFAAFTPSRREGRPAT